MRKYGQIQDVDFRHQGYDIYNLAQKYKLISYHGTKFVYVNSMAELKEEIAIFNEEGNAHG